MNTTDYEIKLLNLDEFGSFLFIITIIISMYITEINKNELKEKKYRNIKNLQLFNRCFVIALLFLFFYINAENLKIAKFKNKDLKPFQLQIVASILVIIASFIALYILHYNGEIASTENPEI